MNKITYKPEYMESFDKKWLIHKKCKEWWYATGILSQMDGRLGASLRNT